MPVQDWEEFPFGSTAVNEVTNSAIVYLPNNMQLGPDYAAEIQFTALPENDPVTDPLLIYLFTRTPTGGFGNRAYLTYEHEANQGVTAEIFTPWIVRLLRESRIGLLSGGATDRWTVSAFANRSKDFAG